MKLKKIASLMLAGIMAVSMLAGCKSGTTPDDTKEPDAPVATGIVAAVNNGQNAYNTVKIDFTADSALDSALEMAVKSEGDNAQASAFMATVAKLVGVNYDANMAAVIKTDKTGPRGELVNSNVDGRVVTDLNGFKVENALNENAAMKIAAKKINDDAVSQLKDTTFINNTTKSGDKYADYSYAGTVSMVSVDNLDGTTDYYVAYTITKTTAVVTFNPAE